MAVTEMGTCLSLIIEHCVVSSWNVSLIYVRYLSSLLNDGTPYHACVIAACWAEDPNDRPNFEEIMVRLQVIEYTKEYELPPPRHESRGSYPGWKKEKHALFFIIIIKICEILYSQVADWKSVPNGAFRCIQLTLEE